MSNQMYLPGSVGQRSVLHSRSSVSSPGHVSPPFNGAGSSHARVLDCRPVLHSTEHSLHSLHEPQFPSTTNN